MIEINLRDFFLTGWFGPITLGMTRQQIAEAAGDPVTWGPEEYRSTSGIWRYGTMEFYFPRGGDALVMIFTDYLDPVNGGEAFWIDPWIVSAGVRLEDAESLLATEGLAARREYDPNTAAFSLVFDSGAGMTFHRDEDDQEYRLTGFQISAGGRLNEHGL